MSHIHKLTLRWTARPALNPSCVSSKPAPAPSSGRPGDASLGHLTHAWLGRRGADCTTTWTPPRIPIFPRLAWITFCFLFCFVLVSYLPFYFSLRRFFHSFFICWLPCSYSCYENLHSCILKKICLSIYLPIYLFIRVEAHQIGKE